MTEDQAKQTVRLARVTDAGARHSGGTVSHRVYLGGLWIGWVGVGREWKGWREDGDTAARWSPGLAHRTCTAALAALIEQIGQGQS